MHFEFVAEQRVFLGLREGFGYAIHSHTHESLSTSMDYLLLKCPLKNTGLNYTVAFFPDLKLAEHYKRDFQNFKKIHSV